MSRPPEPRILTGRPKVDTNAEGLAGDLVLVNRRDRRGHPAPDLPALCFANGKPDHVRAVVASLTGPRLAFWLRRFKGRDYSTARMIEDEMERRRISRKPKDQNGQLIMFEDGDA